MRAATDEAEVRVPRGLVAGCVAACVALAALAALTSTIESARLQLLYLLAQVVVISLVIWQACDPFADAAQWIGTRLRLPGSVRGATLDAVASSMPELFSGIFFVVLAVGHGVGGATPAAMDVTRGEGFSATIATCAGSAVYNMVLIPAVCAVVISCCRRERPTIDVERQVITRDGLWFLYCEIILVLFLFQPTLHWWMAVVLLGLYVVYLLKLLEDARAHRKSRPTESVREDDGEPPRTAGVLFRSYEIPLTTFTAWTVIGVSTCIAAAACYWLVEVTRAAAEQLHVPLFFVAVILAAAASSVPDTLLSIGAARRGDDDGAVSNAFGSNIFDICVCLTIPLLVASYLNGWQPIALTSNGESLPGLVGLRLMLCVLTVVTLAVMWHRQQLNRAKALLLVALYGAFVAYAVAGSMGFELI